MCKPSPSLLPCGGSSVKRPQPSLPTLLVTGYLFPARCPKPLPRSHLSSPGTCRTRTPPPPRLLSLRAWGQHPAPSEWSGKATQGTDGVGGRVLVSPGQEERSPFPAPAGS